MWVEFLHVEKPVWAEIINHIDAPPPSVDPRMNEHASPRIIDEPRLRHSHQERPQREPQECSHERRCSGGRTRQESFHCSVSFTRRQKLDEKRGSTCGIKSCHAGKI